MKSFSLNPKSEAFIMPRFYFNMKHCNSGHLKDDEVE